MPVSTECTHSIFSDLHKVASLLDKIERYLLSHSKYMYKKISAILLRSYHASLFEVECHFAIGSNTIIEEWKNFEDLASGEAAEALGRTSRWRLARSLSGVEAALSLVSLLI